MRASKGASLRANCMFGFVRGHSLLPSNRPLLDRERFHAYTITSKKSLIDDVPIALSVQEASKAIAAIVEPRELLSASQ